MARMKSLDAYLAVEKALLVRQGIFKNRRIRGPVAYRLDSDMEAAAFAALDQLKEATGHGAHQD